MMISKVSNNQKFNKTDFNPKASNQVSFGLKSNLLSDETNVLLGKVIDKFNKKNEQFADVLRKSRIKFEKKNGVKIEMPEQLNLISSFATGKKSIMNLETPLSKGIKIRFSNLYGYKGEYASVEKIGKSNNSSQHIKYEIGDDWLDIISDDKSKNIVYTTSQMPEYQECMFKDIPIEKTSNPAVFSDIQKIDKDIADSLMQFLNKRQNIFSRIINSLKNQKNGEML